MMYDIVLTFICTTNIYYFMDQIYDYKIIKKWMKKILIQIPI